MDRIYVVGAGGIGCAVGYALVAAGSRVTFIDSDPAKIEWGKNHGVQVDRRPPLAADFISFADWQPEPGSTILLCTKCYDNALVIGRLPPDVDLFEAPHNQQIKWDHLLRQTSDWQGTLWGKPDWADRPEGEKPADWPHRKLYEPGTHYKYNDVRVNAMALAALEVWRRPLPEVLREEVMEPIGASSTWPSAPTSRSRSCRSPPPLT